MDKLVRNKSIFQKIIITCILVVLVNFAVPIYSHADDDEWTLMGSLMKELTSLVRGLGDIVEGLLNHFMLGTSKLWKSSMVEIDDPNIGNPESALYADPSADGDNVVSISADELSETLITKKANWKIPNILYSPESIFGNKIAALDVNFINPHTYTPVEGTEEAKEKAVSAAQTLGSTIATWYKSFRNIAVVALLSVLVYMGIRIILSTTAQDKAKYKEAVKDWAVALCMVFMIHFIMSATMILVDKVTELFGASADQGVIIKVTDLNEGETNDGSTQLAFKTNFMGYMRFRSQSTETGDVVAYTIIYIVLVIQTVMFTVQYLKRLLYMAFFTMIAPLVALTYPIDKMGDGQAQAFNMWFKEYTLNAILQPIHLLLYTMLITSAMALAVNNPIYAIVAIGFLVPAEKFIKKMFKLDRAESEGGLGGFAGGALAMQGWQQLTKALGNGGKKADKDKSGDSGKIRTQDNKEALPGTDNTNLASWKDGDDSNNSSNTINQTRSDTMNEEDSNIRQTSQNGINSEEQQESQTRPLYGKTYGYGEGYFVPTEDGGYREVNPDGTPKEQTSSDDNQENLSYAQRAYQYSRNNPTDANRPELDEQELNRRRHSTYGNQTMVGQKISTKGNAVKNKIMQKGGQAKKKITGYAKNTMNNAPAGVKVLGRGAKAAGKKIWKNKKPILKRAAGIAGGAFVGGMGMMIGAAAAIAQGDSGKLLTNTVAGGAAGYMAGQSLGAGGVSLLANAGHDVVQAKNTIQNTYNEEKYGLSQAREMRLDKENAKAKKKFMKDDAEKRKYKDIVAQINDDKQSRRKNYTVEDIMSAAYDYKNSGLDDEKIARGLTLEARHGEIGDHNHNRMVNVMQEASKYSKDYIEDEKKRVALEERMRHTFKNDEEKTEKFMDLFAEAHGDDQLDNYKGIKRERERANRHQRGNTEDTHADNNSDDVT